MPVFSKYYNTGLLCGIASAVAISGWWYNRDSTYVRVKAVVDAEKATKEQHH